MLNSALVGKHTSLPFLMESMNLMVMLYCWLWN